MATIVKTANECKLDPIKLKFLYCMQCIFAFFFVNIGLIMVH